MSECAAALDVGQCEIAVSPHAGLDGELCAKRNAVVVRERVGDRATTCCPTRWLDCVTLPILSTWAFNEDSNHGEMAKTETRLYSSQ